MGSTSPYQFPKQFLKTKQTQSDKTPLVLVACGSFSPPTLLHLRMFVMAADYVRLHTDYELMAAYMSPVGDTYKKAGLVAANHRYNMCQIATKSSSWMDVDHWESMQPEYVPTLKVLEHFDDEINGALGGVRDVNGVMKPVKISLLAGTDLMQTMSQPGLWSGLPDLFESFGVFVVGRAGTDSEVALAGLKDYKNGIWFVPQVLNDENSSTKIRFLLMNDMSVDYLTPRGVIEYIRGNGLYVKDQVGIAHQDGR